MSLQRNTYLDHGLSDESDLEAGYDSEAAEDSKDARISSIKRSAKRRKLSQSEDEDEDVSSDEVDQTFVTARDTVSEGSVDVKAHSSKRATRQGSEDERVDDDEEDEEEDFSTPRGGATHNNLSTRTSDPRFKVDRDLGSEDDDDNANGSDQDFKIKSAATALEPSHEQDPQTKRTETKEKRKPGVVYLSSLPPYLKPSALRTLLTQRGFSPITRLFLKPLSKAKAGSKKNSRQLYEEGWIEFANKKTARRCAETLNATIIGGRKGSFYYDDKLNMKYLRGMGWDELMAGIREERREEEGRRDEERRVIERETRRFVEDVEEGRRVEGMQRKRKLKMKPVITDGGGGGGGEGEVKRTWRQYAPQTQDQDQDPDPSQQQGLGLGLGLDDSRSKVATRKRKKQDMSEDVQAILGKIF